MVARAYLALNDSVDLPFPLFSEGLSAAGRVRGHGAALVPDSHMAATQQIGILEDRASVVS
jgi:hypothetical protein